MFAKQHHPTHRESVGRIYDFMVAAYGDSVAAKADFVKFLSGEVAEPLD
jgi:hypothetical protein